jgi:hypothetical protein
VQRQTPSFSAASTAIEVEGGLDCCQVRRKARTATKTRSPCVPVRSEIADTGALRYNRRRQGHQGPDGTYQMSHHV